MTDRGVSGFWLDIKSLEIARTTLIAELGAKEGMLAYGVWVRLFTWQYHTATPIKDAAHVARLTGLNARTAQRLLCSLAQSLPRSLHQRSGQWYVQRTMQVLDKARRNQGVTRAQYVDEKQRDPDPDPDPDLSSSLSPLNTPNSESKTTLGGRSVKSQTRRNTSATTRKLSTGPEYSEAFLRCWDSRPKRAGSDDKKRAVRAWNARLKEGRDGEAMEDGVRRYREFCEKADKISTEYVMQLATFLGPSDPPHFLQAWEIQKQANKHGESNVDRLRREMPDWFGGVTIDGELVK